MSSLIGTSFRHRYGLKHASTTFIMGVRIFFGTPAELEKNIREFFDSTRHSSFIACLNPHSYTLLRVYPDYRTALSRSMFSLVDGIGIYIMLIARLGRYDIQRIPGRLLFLACLRICLEKNIRPYIIAPTRQSQDNSISFFRNRGINVAGSYLAEYSFRISATEISSDLKNAYSVNEPGIVFIFISAPKQEVLAAELVENTSNKLFIPIGGVYDELIDQNSAHGQVNVRLKRFASRYGFEWFYRFIREPQRMWKRIFVSTFLFLILLAISFITLPLKYFLRYLLQ